MSWRSWFRRSHWLDVDQRQKGVMDVTLPLAIGLAVGAIARLLFPGTARGGWAMPMVIGAAGSILGSLLGPLFEAPAFEAPAFEWEVKNFSSPIIGAVVLVVVYRGLLRERAWG